tara:strand:- start:3734 stop:4879 length:1146 start_codon:yes stop_codon:yes gene_type:complete
MNINVLIDHVHRDDGPVPNFYGQLPVPPELEHNTTIRSSYFADEIEKWIYPIVLPATLSPESYVSCKPEFKKILPKKVFDCINKGKGLVIVYYHEPLYDSTIETLKYMMDSDPIFKNVLILTLHEVDHPRILKGTFVEVFTPSIKSGFRYDDNQLVDHTPYSNEPGNSREYPKSTLDGINDKLYTCFMFTFYESEERFVILNLLQDLQLLDDGIVTCYDKAKKFKELYNSLQTSASWVKTTPTFSQFNSVYNFVETEEALNKSLLNLVVECDFDGIYPFFSEKTSRNFYYKKPFIILGRQGVAKNCRNLGYETFHEILDESYDSEPDTKKRLFKALLSLKQVKKDGLDKKKLKDIVDHNYDNFHKRKSFLENEIKCRLNAL